MEKYGIVKDGRKWTLSIKGGKGLHASGGMPIDWECVLANDVIFGWEYNPHDVHLFAIYGIYGLFCMVWAGNLQDALDEAADSGFLDAISLDEDASEDEKEDAASLGNANTGELFDLNDVGMVELRDDAFPPQIVAAFAEARGANAKNLGDYIR